MVTWKDGNVTDEEFLHFNKCASMQFNTFKNYMYIFL